MKIALLNYRPIYNIQGGVEKVWSEMANALHQKGHDIHLFFFRPKKGKFLFPLNSTIPLHNGSSFLKNSYIFFQRLYINLYYRNQKNKRNFYRLKLRSSIIGKTLTQHIQKFSPDVVIAFHIDAMLRFKKLNPNTPVILMLHSDPKVYFEYENILQFEYKDLLLADKVQVLNPEYINFLSSKGIKNTIYIPNCTEPTPELSSLTNPKIIHVGRVARRKQQLLLVQEFAKIHQNFPDWTLDLWGDNTCDKQYTNEIRSYIKEHHLENQVFLRGVTNNIHKELLNASIFAFPSQFEGFPLALLEAMSRQLPCIGLSSCVSVASIIKHNVSGIITTDNKLHHALYKLMTDQTLRLKLGHNALLEAKKYSPSCIWAQWRNLLLQYKH